MRRITPRPATRRPEAQCAGRALGAASGGCRGLTPHWGFALWNLRGSFGVADSERADVTYEDYKGHKLDRKMLELLRRY